MKPYSKLILIFLIAFLFRIGLMFIAYHGDLNNNISWGAYGAVHGFNGYYEVKDWSFSAPNQPPLTILMFSELMWIWGKVNALSWLLNTQIPAFPSGFIWFWEARGMILLVKLPSILADLGIGLLIYKYLESKKLKLELRLKLLSVWLFNPVVWYNSAIWGQTDSIVNLLGLISILALLKKKLSLSFVFLSLSLLFKGSLAIFLPIILLVALLQKQPLNTWFKAVCCSLFVVVLVSIPFHPFPDLPLWLVNLYTLRILPGEIGYLTANAFNFWWLVNPGKVYDSEIYFGLPARVWSILFTLIGVGGTLLWLRKSISDRRIFISLALISLVSFLFLTRIHERYLYPFFPIGTVLLGLSPQLWIPYILLSIIQLLNLYNLFWAPSFQPLESLLKIPQIPQLLSLVNILIFIFLLRHLRSSKL